MAPCPPSLALGHLLIRLRPLQRALRMATELRDAITTRLREAGATAEAITRGHVDAILDDLDHLADHRPLSVGPAPLADDELAAERTRPPRSLPRAKTPRSRCATSSAASSASSSARHACSPLTTSVPTPFTWSAQDNGRRGQRWR